MSFTNLLFKSGYNHTEAELWMRDNWKSIGLTSTSLYVLLIFSGQAMMRDRPAFSLRWLLVLWNMSLALFSIIGAINVVPVQVNIAVTKGLYASTCVVEDSTRFWIWVFVLSKLPELGDTFFIVVRKQKLIFLHWYHHVTVLLYCWYTFTDYTSSSQWFSSMNYSVHAIMYSYYMLRAMGLRVPRWAAMTITFLQLVQMVVGCALNCYVYFVKQQGVECRASDGNVKVAFVMYFSYFVLFARFFYLAYIAGKDKPRKGDVVKNGHALNGVNGIKKEHVS